MAPNRRAEIAQMGILSIIGGTLCTLMIAAVVGVFI
jgi:nucleoside permease NupC